MNLKKTVILFGFTVIILVATQIGFAQDQAAAPIDKVINSDQPFAPGKESDMQWAWGEVTNLDSQANTITLKYLDYETDQEQDLILVVDEKTTFENIKDFNELKLKDTLSIDYMIGADNKNIAKNISFEKPDDSSSVLPPVAAADLAQSSAQTEMPPDASIAAKEPLAVEPVLTPAAPVEPAAAPTLVEPASAPVEELAPAPTTPAEPAPEPAPAPAALESAPAAQSQVQ